MTDPESLLSHAGFVRALARAAVRGDDEVDDVVQETWLSALQGRPKGSVRGWLASIVRRRAADLARLRGAQRRRDRVVAKEEAVPAQDVVERAEVGRGLVGDVLALDEPYRTALLLRYHEGLAPREIAARLGLPVETVRTHVKRGLERLRERLDSRHGDRRAWMLALAPWLDPAPPPTPLPPRAAPLAAATKVALAVAVLAVFVAVPLWILRSEPRRHGLVAPSSAVDFGRVPYGEERVLPVVLRNDGPRDVLVSNVHVNCGCFHVDPGFSHVVAAGGEVSISVRLVARAVPVAPLQTKRLTIHSDDSTAPRIEVLLQGEIVAGPALVGRDAPAAAPTEPGDRAAADPAAALRGVVVDAGGGALGGATVRALRRPWNRLGLLTEGDILLREEEMDATTTTADGSFALRLAPADVVDLRVSAPGRATIDVSERAAGGSVRIVLEEAVRLDVGVADDTGRPIPGARVRLLGKSPSRDATLLRQGTTDERGGVSFDDLPPRWQILVVTERDGFAPDATRAESPASGKGSALALLSKGKVVGGRVFDTGNDAPISGARVGVAWLLLGDVVTDAAGRYEVRVPSAPGLGEVHVRAEGYPHAVQLPNDEGRLDFPLSRGAVLTGRILSAEGEPVEGAFVGATWTARGAAGGPSQEMSAAVGRTAADGGFRLVGLRPGVPHVLGAWAAGRGGAMRRVDVDAAESNAGDLRLSTHSSIRGRVVDAEGRPTPAARVRLARGEAQGPDALQAERFTDDDGRFAFGALEAGGYRVDVSGDSRVVDVPEDGRAEDLEFAPRGVAEARSVAATKPRGSGRIARLRVVADDGTPISGAHVHVRGADPKSAGFGETTEDGSLSLEVPPEAVKVRVSPGLKDSQRYLPVERPFADVETEGRVVLPRAATVSGRVIGTDGRALPNAEVTAQRDGVRLTSTVSDAAGAFLLGMPPGEPVDVVLTGTTYVPGSYGTTGAAYHLFTAVRRGVSLGTSDVELRAEVPAMDRTLRVRVLGPDEIPVADADVVVLPGHGLANPTGKTDGTGTVVFRDLPAVQVQVGARGPSDVGRVWLPPHSATSVEPRGQELVLHLREGVMFRGLVLAPDGAPATNVRVNLSWGYAAVGMVATDANGRFAVFADPDRSPRLDVAVEHRRASGERWTGRLEGVDVRGGEVTLRLAR